MPKGVVGAVHKGKGVARRLDVGASDSENGEGKRERERERNIGGRFCMNFYSLIFYAIYIKLYIIRKEILSATR